ncbi:CBS domain-containing protein [Halococcus sp. PRR34]|uniref:CBS domain-containing protein n=1 Tax=Halococcus sp. PRR34 TaxID=3020830 RepID=UPI00235E649D|nr:CBS domain-containing protein [Halococcus sp. PRR34]
MKFFTAGDVLDQQSEIDLRAPVTIDIGDTIYDAVVKMFRHNFSQLPVETDEGVSGAVTYKSVCRVLRCVPDSNIESMSVRSARVDPKFVGESQDIFGLFRTFARDEYVLIGSPPDLKGILTRYDVFYFLRNQFEPFIKIGEIERSLRRMFVESMDDMDRAIEETFSSRDKEDSSFSAPDSVEMFTFENYKMFISQNMQDLPDQLSDESEFVTDLLQEVQRNRNALLHFRSGVDEIDREVINVAHSYFDGITE